MRQLFRVLLRASRLLRLSASLASGHGSMKQCVGVALSCLCAGNISFAIKLAATFFGAPTFLNASPQLADHVESFVALKTNACQVITQGIALVHDGGKLLAGKLPCASGSGADVRPTPHHKPFGRS
jgi:hypothetical protein